MLSLLFAIITLEIDWLPNPATDQIIRYELLISTASTMTNPTVISVLETIGPDTRVHHSVANWDTNVEKFIAVRAVNPFDTSGLSGVLHIKKPQVPGGLAAKKH